MPSPRLVRVKDNCKNNCCTAKIIGHKWIEWTQKQSNRVFIFLPIHELGRTYRMSSSLQKSANTTHTRMIKGNLGTNKFSVQKICGSKRVLVQKCLVQSQRKMSGPIKVWFQTSSGLGNLLKQAQNLCISICKVKTCSINFGIVF